MVRSFCRFVPSARFQSHYFCQQQKNEWKLTAKCETNYSLTRNSFINERINRLANCARLNFCSNENAYESHRVFVCVCVCVGQTVNRKPLAVMLVLDKKEIMRKPNWRKHRSLLCSRNSPDQLKVNPFVFNTFAWPCALKPKTSFFSFLISCKRCCRTMNEKKFIDRACSTNHGKFMQMTNSSSVFDIVFKVIAIFEWQKKFAF